MMRIAVLAGLAAAVAGAALVHPPSSAPLGAGTLNLRATMLMISAPVTTCPAETPDDASGCRVRTAKASFSGLGSVSEAYNWSYRMGPPSCPSADVGKPLSTTGRLVVAGKGEIRFTVADGKRCVDEEPLRNEPQDFTITGGTGTYEGASGSGTLERSLTGGRGSERWTGTIVVPGYEFDVTPPALSGAKLVVTRAPKGTKRVRVTYSVKAIDAKDGQVPVTCLPRSGSRFPIGRTVVKCSATDSSANTDSMSFRVTVRQRGRSLSSRSSNPPNVAVVDGRLRAKRNSASVVGALRVFQ